ncbi:MAG: DUF4838 domain-containing protein [Lentisphaerae bacterium]|nr:DUF4838 domain-containing protein [Lentisphaerota bacterium]
MRIAVLSLGLMLLAGCSSFRAAPPCFIISGGTSNYQIVIPAAESGGRLQPLLQQAAEQCSTLLQRGTGVLLPVVTEDQRDPQRPGIYLGQTARARELGLLPEKFSLWEHQVLCRSGELFLFGDDRPPLTAGSGRVHYTSVHLGSVKALTVFLEKFAQTAFIAGDAEWISILPQDCISVPEGFTFRAVPRLQYSNGRVTSMFYDLGNGLLPAPWYGCYGGHSHNVAIPPKKYFDSHPEYFQLFKGKRVSHPTRPQYCLSNPAVRELIYQELLQHLDAGYEMVQLGASDGFIPCECEPCRELYGQIPVAKPGEDGFRNDPAWGEKLWIMHREMAQRLLQDRPGKRVCILSYGPTLQPPRTFTSFPENVTIELAPYRENLQPLWQKFAVRDGFVTYIYNWGGYQREGMTPHFTWEKCRTQARNFLKHNIKGIYRCGFGELFGLEGATYYIWAKLLQNPEQSVEKLLTHYCQHAFREAAPEMEKFYRLLDSRIALTIPGEPKNWDDPALLDGEAPASPANYRLLALRYPPQVLAELEGYLRAAEQTAPELELCQKLLDFARLEFDYLCLTAKAVQACNELRRTLSPEANRDLIAAVLARNQFIASQKTTRDGTRFAPLHGRAIFGNSLVSDMYQNGTLSALLFGPLSWDAQWWQDKQMLLAGRDMDTRAEGEYLLPINCRSNDKLLNASGVTVKCRLAENEFQVIFTIPGPRQFGGDKETIIVQLGQSDTGSPLYWYSARLKPSGVSHSQLALTDRDNNGQGSVYRPREMKGQKPANVTIQETEPGVLAIMHIPFEHFSDSPKPGQKWIFNATYSRSFPEENFEGIWNYNIQQRNWRHRWDLPGTLTIAQ